jgi:hypothetical protein
VNLIVGVLVGGVGGLLLCACCCITIYWTKFQKPGNAVTIHHEEQRVEEDFIPEVMAPEGARVISTKSPRPLSENFSQFFFPEAGTYQAGQASPHTPL